VSRVSRVIEREERKLSEKSGRLLKKDRIVEWERSGCGEYGSRR